MSLGKLLCILMASLAVVRSQDNDANQEEQHVDYRFDVNRIHDEVRTTVSNNEIEDDESEIRNEFNAWMKRFGKNYKGTQEYYYRYEIFKKRYISILKFNKTKASYKKGINFFSDLLPDERLSYLGSIDREDDEADKDEEQDFTRYLEKDKRIAEEIRSIPFAEYQVDRDQFWKKVSELSIGDQIKNLFRWNNNFWRRLRNRGVCGSRDWHASGHMTAVRNQSSCGSCWAFAAVGLVEAMYKIKNNITLNLSEQELVDCDGSSNGCSGGSTWRALGYIRKQRIHRESIYPYVASDQTCASFNRYKYPIRRRRRTLRRRTRNFLNRLCRQPLHISYYVSDEFFDYSSGIYDGAGCAGQSGTNHAVVAVGHNIRASTPFVKLKNSWGSWWGENGYFRMILQSSLITNGTCNMLYRRPSYVHV